MLEEPIKINISDDLKSKLINSKKENAELRLEHARLARQVTVLTNKIQTQKTKEEKSEMHTESDQKYIGQIDI